MLLFYRYGVHLALNLFHKLRKYDLPIRLIFVVGILTLTFQFVEIIIPT